MPFGRTALGDLTEWLGRGDAKPLLVRGARQVGKTTLVRMLANRVDVFVDVDLDVPGAGRVFRREMSAEDVYRGLLLERGLSHPESGKALVFLDEIQRCPEAIGYIRRFHEYLPHVKLVCAGSLLEVALARSGVEFPVGRVEHLFMHPLSFEEFLRAAGEDDRADLLDHVPLPPYAHDPLRDSFRKYAITGGMPEAVDVFAESGSYGRLHRVFSDLLVSLSGDVARYARNPTAMEVLRFCMEAAPAMAGERITFEGFGGSGYRSREVSEAVRTLQRAMIVHLIRATTSVRVPVQTRRRMSPRLQLLDTGIMSYAAGLEPAVHAAENLADVYRGRFAEHVVGQELIAADRRSLAVPHLWTGGRRSQAEVDFVLPHGELLVPVEVKSGSTGRLRSLHSFIDRSPHAVSVRLADRNVSLDRVRTPRGKEFVLLNLPLFLACRIHSYLDWALEKGG